MTYEKMSNNLKWSILSPSSGEELDNDEKKLIWDELHECYGESVFSITDDSKFCRKLIEEIPNSADIRILIPGCGSKIFLQQHLLSTCSNITSVYCTEISDRAISIASENWKQYTVETQSAKLESKVIFENIDSTRITKARPEWKDYFDYVLIANSVLSGEDLSNRQMIDEFYQVLKPGGKLYGSFPSIFCALEIAHLEPSASQLLTNGNIDLQQSSFCFTQNNRQRKQIFYTPLRLNRIFKEVGFKRNSFEIYFCEGENFNTRNIYGIEDPDIHIWEIIASLEKP